MGRQKSAPPAPPVTSDAFGWNAARLACLVHSSLPFSDATTVDSPMLRLGDRHWSQRDMISLVGQYAAHVAFLQFAGIVDDAFFSDDWRVVQKRGVDARLVRLRATGGAGENEPMPLTLIDEFAASIGASGFATLNSSWASPEAVFIEACKRLHEVTTHHESLEAAGIGQVLAPGEEALMRLSAASAEIVVSDDEDAAASLVRFIGLAGDSCRRILEIGAGASPIRPLSAFSSEVTHGRNEHETLDALIDGLIEPAVIAVRGWERFDAASRRVTLELVNSSPHHSFLLPSASGIRSTHSDAEPTRTFVASPSLASRAAVISELASFTGDRQRRWLEIASSSGSLSRFFLTGEMPAVEGAAALRDPLRAYASALAIVGSGISSEEAAAVLAALGGSASVDDLVRAEVVNVSGGIVSFRSEAERAALAATAPLESARIVAATAIPILSLAGNAAAASRMALDSGDVPTALALLERADLESLSDNFLDLVLGRVDASTFPESLALRLAKILLRRGRYDDARRLAHAIDADDGRLIVASASRRVGAYGEALETIASCGETFEVLLLRGELNRLAGRIDLAAADVQRGALLATTDGERARVAYESALVDIDAGRDAATDWLDDAERDFPYYSARFRGYAAGAAHDYASAVKCATVAIESADGIAERIDASLDLVYALFMAGSWDSARRHARSALNLVEQTQGDRAAAGILFTLAFLSADAGHFPQARAEIDRLHRFFTARGDSRRERELDLLEAQLALGEWRLDDAVRSAESVVDAHVSADVREAANLILDEVSWVRGTMTLLHSGEGADCAELRDRARLCRARFERRLQPEITNSVLAALQEWELDPDLEPPAFEHRGEKLKLLRSCAGLWRASGDAAMKHRVEQLASELQLVVRLDLRHETSPDLEILRAAATRPYPFDDSTFAGIPWSYVSKNRLGRWNRLGSGEVEPENYERLFEGNEADWVRCSDRAFLHIEGIDSWPEESRQAIAALFALRAEHYNLKRAMEEPAAGATEPAALGIVGDSAAIRAVRTKIQLVAKSDVPVCVEGESGTGKELVAKAIHLQSERRSKKFTAINCAALPETLIESELFGAARGAFTSADRDRAGLIEQSDGGTLFLDEVGELPLPSQAKLLRFLQGGEFRRVGDATLRTADVRIVTATNRRLEAAVENGTFRQDLYYRIRVVEVVVPPLRERGSDILVLARFFLEQEHAANRRGPVRLSEEVESVLLSYSWPGNVRELQNSIRAANALAGDAREIQLEHLPARLQVVPARQVRVGSLNDEITNFRRLLIERSLRETGGNQNQAAKLLGVTRQALAYQIRELGIIVKS